LLRISINLYDGENNYKKLIAMASQPTYVSK